MLSPVIDSPVYSRIPSIFRRCPIAIDPQCRFQFCFEKRFRTYGKWFLQHFCHLVFIHGRYRRFDHLFRLFPVDLFFRYDLKITDTEICRFFLHFYGTIGLVTDIFPFFSRFYRHKNRISICIHNRTLLIIPIWNLRFHRFFSSLRPVNLRINRQIS